jgi:hypothetical protein
MSNDPDMWQSALDPAWRQLVRWAFVVCAVAIAALALVVYVLIRAFA